MKFCKVCNNMLYINQITTDESIPSLKLVCKNCGYDEIGNKNNTTLITEKQFSDVSEKKDDEICVLKINCKDDSKNFKQYQTPYIKYDYTLPRLRNIQCKNNCKNNDGINSEVICVGYDRENLKYLYFCTKCELFWKLEKN